MEATQALTYLIVWMFPIAIALGVATSIGCIVHYVRSLSHGDASSETLGFGIATGIVSAMLAMFVFTS